mgnify:CR=1 FL=1
MTNMRKFNRLLTITLGIILIFTVVSSSEEKENYFDKVQQEGIDYTLGESVGEIITKVKQGEVSGKEALGPHILSSDKIDDTMSGLSKLVLVNPPDEDVKSLKDDPEDGIIHLKEGHTWTEVHQKIIQTITYYVVAQLITRRAFTDFDLQQMKSAKKFIELGDKAKEQYISMTRFEELE